MYMELSRLLMFDFFYKHIKAKYGSLAKPLFSDTDSLRLEIKTEDTYADMASEVHLFDFSEYPRYRFLNNTEKKI